MASVTELALFNACVEQPSKMALDDLNLSQIDGPKDTHGLSDKQILEKKAIKVYHMAWSGITKYIR